MNIEAAQDDFLILIVDDSMTNRILLREHLSTAGYRSIEASRADEALMLLERQSPDLILLDIVMPETTGLELCSILKANEATRDIPIIFLTYLDEPDIKVKGLQLGAVDFITKPFEPAEILARVKIQAKMFRMYQTIREHNLRMARDLNTARHVQRDFLPARGRQVATGIAYEYTFDPCDELGGDFFNIFAIAPKRLLVYISDVSGHGVASALMTIFADTYFRSHAGPDSQPGQLLAGLNQEFFRAELGEKHIVVFAAILDLERNTLAWSSAGQCEPPILTTPDGARFLEMNSFPIGLIEEAEYAEQREDLPSEVSLLMYSDGLTELTTTDGDVILTADALKRLVQESPALRQRELLDKILERVLAERPEADYPDDLTLFIVNRRTPL